MSAFEQFLRESEHSRPAIRRGDGRDAQQRSMKLNGKGPRAQGCRRGVERASGD